MAEDTLIKSSNSEFLFVIVLDGENFGILNSNESIVYRSKKYGRAKYINKILIKNNIVIEYRN